MSCYIYFDRDQFLLLTSIDQSSEIPPYAEGYRDVIDDEVVSFSYSYTVVIYVRTGFLCDLHLCIAFPSLSYSQFVLFSVDWAVTLLYSSQPLFNSVIKNRYYVDSKGWHLCFYYIIGWN